MRSPKKTTIALPPELHRQLASLARHRGTSLDELVRQACEVQYGVTRPVPAEVRLAAVRELAGMSLPVGSPSEMKRQSVPGPDDLLP